MGNKEKKLGYLLGLFMIFSALRSAEAAPNHDCDIIAKSRDKTITRCSFEKEICYIVESFVEIRNEPSPNGVAISCFKN